MKEIFKDVLGYEGMYQVSNLGNVKSIKYNRNLILAPCVTKKNYLRVNLNKNGVKKNYLVHRLVAQAFIYNIENKPQVNHINGIKNDNRIENLEWVNNSENKKHAFKTGLTKAYYGENHPQAKLTNNQIAIIRADNRPQRTIAKDYNISQSTVWAIKTGYLWAKV